jgi:hypothetical protein
MKLRIQNNYEIYRRRQVIVEHPMGSTDNGGFYYIMTKKPKTRLGDVGLIFTAYKCVEDSLNLIDPIEFKQYLKALPLILIIMRSILRRYSSCFFCAHQTVFFTKLFFVVLNQLTFKINKWRFWDKLTLAVTLLKITFSSTHLALR